MRKSSAFRAFGLSLGIAAAAGCASLNDPFVLRTMLEDAQRSYTQYRRWGDHNKAIEFVDKEWYSAYRQQAQQLSHFHVTDYEVEEFEYAPNATTATVRVVYYAFGLRSVTELPIRETQIWVRDEMSREWRVRPALIGFEAGSAEP